MVTGEHVVWWMILAALSGWSYVVVWSTNSASLAGLYPNHFAGWITLFFVLGLSTAGLAYLLSPRPARWDRSYVIAVVTLILTQSWQRVLLAVEQLSTDVGVIPTWTLTIALAATVVVLIFRLVPLFPITRAVVGVLTVFLVGLHYLNVVQHAWGEVTSSSTTSPETLDVAGGSASSDVLVVVLDGYGRTDVLDRAFGYDNSGFEKRLTEHGVVVVPQSKANYSATALSVGGLLDGRYLGIGRQDDAQLEDLHEIHSGNSALFRSLDAAGYEAISSTTPGPCRTVDRPSMSAIPAGSTRSTAP